MEVARGQKHPSEAKNGKKESIYWKKSLIKVAQQPQKPLDRSNQIWDMISQGCIHRGTGETAVKPKFSDTLTLFQPGGTYFAHHQRSGT